VDLHRLAEERSIAYHRAVASRMRGDASILERAKERVRGWIAAGWPHPSYAREWERILQLPTEEMEAALADPAERARALRQVTPFAGALPARERWAIWREFAQRRDAP
jgi:hypothetical protein